MYHYLTILLFSFFLSGWGQPMPHHDEDDPIKVAKVYPNPATSYINFEFDGPTNDEGYTLVIYSFIGKKIQDNKVNSKKVTISLTNFYRGIYIFQVVDKDGHVVESGKFQVVK